MRVKWTRPDAEGVIRAHNLPGVQIEKVTAHTMEGKAVWYDLTVNDAMVTARTLGAAKAFVQAILDAKS